MKIYSTGFPDTKLTSCFDSRSLLGKCIWSISWTSSLTRVIWISPSLDVKIYVGYVKQTLKWIILMYDSIYLLKFSGCIPISKPHFSPISIGSKSVISPTMATLFGLNWDTSWLACWVGGFDWSWLLIGVSCCWVLVWVGFSDCCWIGWGFWLSGGWVVCWISCWVIGLTVALIVEVVVGRLEFI